MKTTTSQWRVGGWGWGGEVKTDNSLKKIKIVLYEEWVKSICSHLPLTKSLNQHH